MFGKVATSLGIFAILCAGSTIVSLDTLFHEWGDKTWEMNAVSERKIAEFEAERHANPEFFEKTLPKLENTDRMKTFPLAPVLVDEYLSKEDAPLVTQLPSYKYFIEVVEKRDQLEPEFSKGISAHIAFEEVENICEYLDSDKNTAPLHLGAPDYPVLDADNIEEIAEYCDEKKSEVESLVQASQQIDTPVK